MSASSGVQNRNTTSLLSQAPAYVTELSHEYEGFIMPNVIPPRCIEGVKTAFIVRPDDVFLVTYPKSGTTWGQQIALLVKHDGDKSKMEGNHIFSMVPFIECTEGVDTDTADTARPIYEIAEEMASPRILKTQLPARWLPKEIQDGTKGKVLYIARNPKDMMVSYFHFCRMVKNLPSYESWDVFFEEFITDRVSRAYWFESVLYWWGKKNHPNVLFLTYEDMKRDHKGAVKQISEFMGKSFSDDIIDTIVTDSTFSSMKNNSNSNPDRMLIEQGIKESGTKRTFMRKGVVGDWKNYFSAEQNQRFDALYKERMAGSGLDFVFEQE